MKKTIFTKAVTVILSLLLILSLFPVSSAEEASAAIKPGKPAVTVKANDDGRSAMITIAKTKNAEGYKIMVLKPGAKKYVKLATVKKDGTAVRTYTAKKLAAGEYKFKVRAYTKSGKKTVWGKYGNIVSVKIGDSPAEGEDAESKVGFITKERTVIESNYLVFDIEPNIYVVPDLEKKADEIFRTMEKVTGLSAKKGKYHTGKITVFVCRYESKNPLVENSGPACGSKGAIWITPSDLFVEDGYAFTHELGHAFYREFVAEFAGTVLDEGFTAYTEMKIAEYLAENDPDLGAVQGPAETVSSNMEIFDHDLLYEHPVEYWMAHDEESFNFGGNGNYGLGFRLMAYLEEKYGSYTSWFYEFNKLVDKAAKNERENNSESLSEKTIREQAVLALKNTYGKNVLDELYPWMKKNEGDRSDDWLNNHNDFSKVRNYTIYPFYWWHTNTTKIGRYNITDYCDLTVNIAPAEFYLREYKGEDTSNLILNVSEGTVVERYDYEGKLIDTVQTTQIPLTGVAAVKLVGKGETVFSITGYRIYSQEDF